jgi:hypothetical protein
MPATIPYKYSLLPSGIIPLRNSLIVQPKPDHSKESKDESIAERTDVSIASSDGRPALELEEQSTASPTEQFNVDSKSPPVVIRLMTLYPGSFDEDICITLQPQIVDPERPVEFEALSYVWGSKTDSKIIYIGLDKQYTLQITQNLANAMRHLRYTKKSRILWVDAICIDQSNVEERSQQVAQMGDIYRRAFRVLGWLGPELDDSSHALKLLDNFGSKVELDIVPYDVISKPSAEGEAEPHWADKEAPLQFDTERDFRGLKCLFDRDWFDRLWIRQEIYLGGDRVQIIVGNQSTSWTRFSNATYCFWCKSPRSDLSEDIKAIYWEIFHRLEYLQGMILATEEQITRLRPTFGKCRCSDPRDRLYAVLNLLSPPFRKLLGRPDYSLSLEEIWKRTIRSFINFAHEINTPFGLVILEECQGIEPFDTPTWCPNLITEDDLKHARLVPFKGSACSGFSENVEFLDVDILRVLGVHVQTVDTTLKIDDFEDTKKALKAFLTAELMNRKPPPGCASILELVVMAVTGGYIREFEDPPQRDRPTWQSCEDAIKTLCSDVTISTPASVTSRDWFAIISDAILKGRCLFTTEAGYIGVGPRTAQQGDKLVIFCGSSLPTLLRPVRELHADTGARYRIMGNCHVPGFMTGEAFLGTIPVNNRAIHVFDPETKLLLGCFKNVETGEVRYIDERLDSWPVDHEGYHKAVLEKRMMRFNLTPEDFNRMGVDVEFFDIV